MLIGHRNISCSIFKHEDKYIGRGRDYGLLIFWSLREKGSEREDFTWLTLLHHHVHFQSFNATRLLVQLETHMQEYVMCGRIAVGIILYRIIRSE